MKTPVEITEGQAIAGALIVFTAMSFLLGWVQSL